MFDIVEPLLLINSVYMLVKYLFKFSSV